MRTIKIVTLVTLLTLGGLLATSRAQALPLQAAAAIGHAANEPGIRQDVAYACRRVWRCGPYACGWRRACYYTPGPFAYAYPYVYRPYWRPYWRRYPRYWARPYWRGRRYWR